MKISRKNLLSIIREEAAKSTKKYDDDSALQGDQDELPDALQKGIIDKTVEDREKNESHHESKIRFTRRQLAKMLREEMELVQDDESSVLDADGLAGVIGDIVQSLTDEEPLVMGDGGRARMAKQQLQQIASTAQSLHDKLNDDDEIPEWTQSNIAVAEDNIDAIADHLGYKMDVQEARLREQDDEKMSSSDFVKAMKGDLSDMMKAVPDAMNDELMGAIKALVAASKFDTSSFKTVIGLIMDKTAKAQEKAEKAG